MFLRLSTCHHEKHFYMYFLLLCRLARLKNFSNFMNIFTNLSGKVETFWYNFSLCSPRWRWWLPSSRQQYMMWTIQDWPTSTSSTPAQGSVHQADRTAFVFLRTKISAGFVVFFSGLRIRIRMRIRLIWVAGSGSRRAKMTHKKRRKWRNFLFWIAGCSLLRAEGFSCSLGVLYRSLGISKLQFLFNKI